MPLSPSAAPSLRPTMPSLRIREPPSLASHAPLTLRCPLPHQAYNAFTEDQRAAIRRHVAEIVHAPIDTLERVGGGGVR